VSVKQRAHVVCSADTVVLHYMCIKMCVAVNNNHSSNKDNNNPHYYYHRATTPLGDAAGDAAADMSLAPSRFRERFA
jgi:hypothetical protein